MLIYLVRWPDLSASLVQAESELRLLDILDQVGNADDCEWSVYEGPLFIDFRLPVEWSLEDDGRQTPVAREQVVIGNVGHMANGNIVETMQLCLADGDDGFETGAEVFRLAFPKLANTMATLPINSENRRSLSTITRRRRRVFGWATPVGMTLTPSWTAVRRASSSTNRRQRGFAPAGWRQLNANRRQ